MRILHIASGDFFSAYGGGQVYVRNIIDEMLSSAVDVVILSMVSKPIRISTYEYKDVPVYEVGTLASIEDIGNLCSTIDVDIVHTHGSEFLFVTLCKSLNIPVIITAHHGGILCPAGTLMNAEDGICQTTLSHRNCLKCCLANIRTGRAWYPFMRLLPEGMYRSLGRKLAGLPFVPFITPIGGVAKSIEDKRAEWQSICSNATMVIAPSHAIAEAMCRNGLSRAKVRVIPHGIPHKAISVERSVFNETDTKHSTGNTQQEIYQRDDTDFKRIGDEFKDGTESQASHDICKQTAVVTTPLSCRGAVGESGSHVRFFFLGRICRVKGLHVLLEAFDDKCFADRAELHIIGGAGNKGEQRYMQSLQRKYQRDNVVWHGKVPSDKVLDTILDFDVMVHPAICMEIFGLNIAEALLMHKPVLATRCGGAEMQIRDGENGWLVEPNSAEALRERMLRIVENGIPFCLDTIDSGVISIEEHVKDLISLYEEKACIDRC